MATGWDDARFCCAGDAASLRQQKTSAKESRLLWRRVLLRWMETLTQILGDDKSRLLWRRVLLRCFCVPQSLLFRGRLLPQSRQRNPKDR